MRRLQTQTRSGVVEKHFEYLGREYVRCEPQPGTNYLFKPSIQLREITNTHERILVGLVSELLFGR